MNHTDLQSLQQRIKFDSPSMSLCLGIEYDQYRRYYYGRAAIPLEVAAKLEQLEQRERDLDAERTAQGVALLNLQFPHGIQSEV